MRRGTCCCCFFGGGVKKRRKTERGQFDLFLGVCGFLYFASFSFFFNGLDLSFDFNLLVATFRGFDYTYKRSFLQRGQQQPRCFLLDSQKGVGSVGLRLRPHPKHVHQVDVKGEASFELSWHQDKGRPNTRLDMGNESPGSLR